MDEWIAGFLSKGATPEEEAQLLTWVTSGNNRKYYEQLYRVWLQTASCGQFDDERVEPALKRVHKKIFEPSVAEKRLQTQKEQKTLWTVMFKYAAAIALLIISTYVLTRYAMMQQLESQITGMTYEAHYGSRAYATLPDGTKVWLNSGSKLAVQPEYQLHERTVELSGEAYFDVETNPERPFIVRVGEISIKATGTAFNVKAYPEEEQITTTLVEGTVFIEGNDEREKEFKVQLQPNQTVSYRRKATIAPSVAKEDTAVQAPLPKPEKQETQKPLTATTSQMKTETLTSWMKDRWIIDNEEFGNLAVQLERRYNVQIRFESEELKQYRFTGTIERETVEQMFDAFRYSIPLKYAIERGIITLSPDVELKKRYEKAWKQ